MTPAHDADDDRGRLLDLINANWTTQAIGVAAALDLPRRLGALPQRSEALAAAARLHEPSLKRLLQALASLGLCAQRDDGCFALTPLGALLHPDTPHSLHAWARLRAVQWPAWGDLRTSVESGEGWRKRQLGHDDFNHLDGDAQAAALFHRAMSDLTRRIAAAVVRAIEFAGDERIVDVGGSSGELLAAIVAAHPAMRGVVFDLAHARAGAVALIAAAGLEERCEFVAGSFFDDALPSGADVYLLKSVLHNWDDERATSILRRCAEAMKPLARLLIVERVAPERWSDCAEHRAVAASDLNMLVALSGRERTAAEFRALLDRCRLDFAQIVPTGAEFSVIEAKRRG